MGDQDAAAEIVRQFEPLILREIRLRLEDSRLRQECDTMDVSQSVLKSFFARAVAGEFSMEDPRQLLALLLTMARRKVVTRARHEHRQKRDRRRLDVNGAAEFDAIPNRDPSPSAIVADAEFVAHARKLLSPDERQIADLRANSCSWKDVASRMGGTAQSRRVQFSRAVDRVTIQLGLAERHG
jgi:RNA polymerase sigma-70 factor (ECF subfamily)